MRRQNAIILFLTIIGFNILFLFPGSVFADSFKVNVSQSDVNWDHGVLTLRDLGVGEYAYLLIPIFCREMNGEMKMLKDGKPNSDIIEDQTNYKITRLPNDQLSIEILPSSQIVSKMVRENFIEQIVDRESTLSCNGYNLIFGTSPEDWFVVYSVDGATSHRSRSTGATTSCARCAISTICAGPGRNLTV